MALGHNGFMDNVTAPCSRRYHRSVPIWSENITDPLFPHATGTIKSAQTLIKNICSMYFYPLVDRIDVLVYLTKNYGKLILSMGITNLV